VRYKYVVEEIISSTSIINVLKNHARPVLRPMTEALTPVGKSSLSRLLNDVQAHSVKIMLINYVMRNIFYA
jgi:spore coat protein CotF